MRGRKRLSIVYVTFGSGSGDLVTAASLSQAFARADVDLRFSAVSNCEFHYLFDAYFDHILVRAQPKLLFGHDRDTDIYAALRMLEPDVLIVSMIWLPLLPIIRELPGLKVFVARKTFDRWWRIPLPDGRYLEFDASPYDLLFNIEPGYRLPWAEQMEPMVICSRDELFPRETARHELGAMDDRPLCVVAHNGYAGELDQILSEEKLDAGSYNIITLTNTQQGRNIFPLAEYARGIDFLIGGAGYNLFYEARYFGIPSRHIPFKRNGDDQAWRLETNRNYSFQENGADTVARRIIELFDKRAV